MNVEASVECEAAATGDSRPWTRADRLALGVVLAGAVVSLPFIVHPWFHASPDAAMYVATARSLLAGEGYSYLGMPFSVRPPGWSLLLAPALALWDGHYHALNLYVAGYGVASMGLLFCLVRPALGPVLAAGVCAFLWLNTTFAMFCSRLMSDVPGVAALLATLLLERWASRASDERSALRRDLLLGVAIGLSAHVRSIGVVVLPAVWAARIVAQWRARSFVASAGSGPPIGGEAVERRRFDGLATFVGRRLLPVAFATFLCLLPWSLRNARVVPGEITDQQLNHSYATAMWRQDRGDPHSPLIGVGELARRFVEQAPMAAASLGSGLASKTLTPTRAVAAFVLFALFAYAFRRRQGAVEFSILGSVALLLVYFGFVPRLILPAFVLLVPSCAEAARDLARRRLSDSLASTVVAVLLLSIAVSSFDLRNKWPRLEAEHERMLGLAAGLREVLPAEARLAAGRGFVPGVYLERPVYSLRWSDRRGEGLPGLLDVIERYRIDHVLLDPAQPEDAAAYRQLAPRFGAGRPVEGFRLIALAESA